MVVSGSFDSSRLHHRPEQRCVDVVVLVGNALVERDDDQRSLHETGISEQRLQKSL